MNPLFQAMISSAIAMSTTCRTCGRKVKGSHRRKHGPVECRFCHARRHPEATTDEKHKSPRRD